MSRIPCIFSVLWLAVLPSAARIVIQKALYLRSRRHTSLTIPWCTYTDPEIAHVGS